MELMELNRYKLDYQVASRFSCESSDRNIALVTDSELIVLKYKPIMDNDDNNLTFDEHYIHCSDYHIANQTGIPIGKLILSLNKDYFLRLMMNEIFTPEISNANPQVTKPVEAHWSSTGVYRKNQAFLGVVSNTGNVEVLLGRHGGWTSITNLTEHLVDRHREEWERTDIRHLSDDKKCKIHEKRVLQCAASCMEWSPIYDNGISLDIYVIIGHLTGEVSIWKINCYEIDNEEKIIPKFITTFNVSSHKITAVHWSSVNKDSAWIVCGDLEGYVKSVLFSFPEPDTFEMKNNIDLWEEEDIQSSKIFSINQNDNSLIIVIKGAFLILSLIDNVSKSLKWSDVVNFGNLFITGLEIISPNNYMISLFTGILKTIEFKISDSKCSYTVTELKTDVNWDIHATHGLVKLPNGYIWGILLYPCKMIDHLSNRKPVEISFCISTKLDPGKCLKENPSQRLEKYWEVMDVIRCTSAKQNTLPCNWLSNISKYDDISIYELRIIYWLSTANRKFLLLNTKTKPLNANAPKPEVLEQIFNLKWRLDRLRYLINIHDSGAAMTANQLCSIYMLKHNIVHIQKEIGYEDYFEDKFIKEANATIEKANGISEVTIPDCIICNIPLVDGRCTQNHIDEHCCVSYVQIAFQAKWNCPLCHGMAHGDIEDEKPYCPICDVPFLPYDLETE